METGIFKNKYKTESARKVGHDYTSNGWYFITICTKNMKPFFGNITDGKMRLSEIGKIAEKYWQEIPKHFPFAELNEFIIMPNHIHGIIGINHHRRDGDLSRLNKSRLDVANTSNPRGGDAMNRDAMNRRLYENVSGAMNRVSTTGGITGENNPMGKNTLGEIIRWYKGRCTFEIGKMRRDKSRLYDNFAWQSRFYDRVIRNEEELDRVRKYIFDNVLKWEFDRNNPENVDIHTP